MYEEQVSGTRVACCHIIIGKTASLLVHEPTPVIVP